MAVWKVPENDDDLPEIKPIPPGGGESPHMRWLALELRKRGDARTALQTDWLERWDRAVGRSRAAAASPLPEFDGSNVPPPTRQSKAQAGAKKRTTQETISRIVTEQEADASQEETGHDADPSPPMPPMRPPPPRMSDYGDPEDRMPMRQPPPMSREASPYEYRRSAGYDPYRHDRYEPPAPTTPPPDEEEEGDDGIPQTGIMVDAAFVAQAHNQLAVQNAKMLEILNASAKLASQSAEESRRNAELSSAEARKAAAIANDNSDKISKQAVALLTAFNESMTHLISTLDKRLNTAEEAQVKAMQVQMQSMDRMGQAMAKERVAATYQELAEAQVAVATAQANAPREEEAPEEEEDEGSMINAKNIGMITQLISGGLRDGLGGLLEGLSQTMASTIAQQSAAMSQEAIAKAVREGIAASQGKPPTRE